MGPPKPTDTISPGLPDQAPVLLDSEYLLPSASLMRVMKKALPDSVKISQDAHLLVSHLATEYICFLTSEASDLSIAAGERSIHPQDLIDAAHKLELQASHLVMQHFVNNE